jgi:hypothetical protein
MSGVTAVEEGDWIVITRLEGPQALNRELHRVLGADWQRDEWGTSRIPRGSWDAARMVFWRLGVPVTLTEPQGTTTATVDWQAPTEQEKEAGVVVTDVKQRATDEDRAAEEQIASLQSRIEELERKREELRLFLIMYDHYAGLGERSGAEAVYGGGK